MVTLSAASVQSNISNDILKNIFMNDPLIDLINFDFTAPFNLVQNISNHIFSKYDIDSHIVDNIELSAIILEIMIHSHNTNVISPATPIMDHFKGYMEYELPLLINMDDVVIKELINDILKHSDYHYIENILREHFMVIYSSNTGDSNLLPFYNKLTDVSLQVPSFNMSLIIYNGNPYDTLR